MRCHKCHQVAPAEGDSWCLGCSSGEALTKELAGHWASAGARTLAEDLILSTVRQVRFLRNLTQGIQSNQRASAQAVSQRAKGEPPERPELARKRPAQASTAHHTTAPKSKANKDTKEESPVHYEEESVEEEETESEAEDPRPVGDGARRPPEPPGPPPGSRTASAGGRHSNRAETSKKESKQSHRSHHSHKPRHRAGRKHQRLGRLEDKPHTKVHRKLSPAVLDTLSADRGRESIYRLP